MKELLKNLISEGKSTYQIAKELGKSQTSIRYQLRKFGLTTLNVSRDKKVSESLNGRLCVFCGLELKGFQGKFCSTTCKSKHHYNNKTYGNVNDNTRQQAVSIEKKMKLIEMSGGKCINCGYCNNSAALTFHHRDPENKVFNLDSRKLTNTNWNSIVEEWTKCDLLCFNCHMELHNPQRQMVGREGLEPSIYRL